MLTVDMNAAEKLLQIDENTEDYGDEEGEFDDDVWLEVFMKRQFLSENYKT